MPASSLASVLLGQNPEQEVEICPYDPKTRQDQKVQFIHLKNLVRVCLECGLKQISLELPGPWAEE